MKVLYRVFLLISIAALVSCKMRPDASDGSEVAAAASQETQAKKNLMGQIEASITGTLDFLIANQVTKTVGEFKLEGEWGSQMLYRKQTFLMDWLTTDVGTETYDSNCYETSTTSILLADTYLKYQKSDPARLDKVVPMLDRAMKKLLACKVESGGFAFWPFISMPEKWRSKFPEGSALPRIRGPKHFPYTSYLGQLQNNNPADVDDTGLSLLAFLKYDQIVRRIPGKQHPYAAIIDEKIGPYYEIYRHNVGDHVAKFPYDGADGAFLVWWGEKSSNFLALGDTNPVMPMNFNIIDCVGNANALGALSLKHEAESTKGYWETCVHVNQMVFNKLDKECALYYPSPYNLHYSIAASLDNGTGCLEASRKPLVADLQDSQLADGSWPPYDQDKSDIVQTTMFALSAYLKLLKTEELQMPRNRDHVYRALKYLLDHHLGGSEHEPINWQPGIHFSAGPALETRDGLRGVIIWKSRGFTNAMMLEILYAIKEIYHGDLGPVGN